MEVINGKPCVVHQVGEKETLFSLARRYGATVNSILEQNPTADGGLEVGQILKIPYVGRQKTGQATKTADGIVHRVAAKETLFSIARLYNVSVDDIKAWNNLKDGTLSMGQELLVRKSSTPPPTEVKVIPTTGARTHTVAPKETLYSISKLYGMSVAQLKEWNSIQDTELKIGQVLTVAAPTGVVAPNVPIETAPIVIAPVVIAPVIATTPPITSTETIIKIDESVNGSSEVKEIGLAALLQGSDGNRKYLAQHRSVKEGTILKIRNLTTNQEVFVRVTGPPSISDESTIILISKSAYDRLGATEAKFRAEITYYK